MTFYDPPDDEPATVAVHLLRCPTCGQRTNIVGERFTGGWANITASCGCNGGELSGLRSIQLTLEHELGRETDLALDID